VRGACDVALGGGVRQVDVALANNIRYLGVAGLGFDSAVTEYANNNVKFLRGAAVYLYAILRVLPRFGSLPVQVTTREGTRREQIMFAAIGNTRQYGGGIRITPSAVIDDGLLDLCLVRETTRRVLLKTLPQAYTGAHVRSPFVVTAREREFAFSSEQPLPIYADGERLTTTPVRFAIAEQKLRVVVPR
jgi:diacylglycerol kinase (ATP)